MIREEVIRNGSGRKVCHIDRESRTIEIVKCGWKTTIQFPDNGEPIITDTRIDHYDPYIKDSFLKHLGFK